MPNIWLSVWCVPSLQTKKNKQTGFKQTFSSLRLIWKKKIVTNNYKIVLWVHLLVQVWRCCDKMLHFALSTSTMKISFNSQLYSLSYKCVLQRTRFPQCIRGSRSRSQGSRQVYSQAEPTERDSQHRCSTCSCHHVLLGNMMLVDAEYVWLSIRPSRVRILFSICVEECKCWRHRTSASHLLLEHDVKVVNDVESPH